MRRKIVYLILVLCFLNFFLLNRSLALTNGLNNGVGGLISNYFKAVQRKDINWIKVHFTTFGKKEYEIYSLVFKSLNQRFINIKIKRMNIFGNRAIVDIYTKSVITGIATHKTYNSASEVVFLLEKNHYGRWKIAKILSRADYDILLKSLYIKRYAQNNKTVYNTAESGENFLNNNQNSSSYKPKNSYIYLGCFKDQGDPFGLRGRDLAAFGFGSDRMTPNICMRECARRGYRYAGVQYSGYCFCGNRYGKYGRAANCNMRCSGDKSKICGGSWANGIYDVARLNIQKVNYGSGVEVNTDRPGLDYKSFNLPYPDYRLCQNACKKDPKCRAWTYVKPYTIQGPQARCWLKGSIPNQVRKSCCISGIKHISSNNTKTFRYPTINGYRLDWCRLWSQDCGQGAADAFCRKMRFTRAIAFEEDYDIGAKSPTYVIGSGKICNQSFCDGFKYITCTGRRFVIPPKKHKQIYTQPNVNKKLNCKDAYRRFVRAYNKLTNLISKGKGNTPEARRAKIEYDSARNAYANCRSANNNQSVSYSIDKCAAYQNKQDYISFRFPKYLNSKKHYINLTCSVYMLPKGSKIKAEWFYVMPNKDYPIGAKTIFVNKTSKKDKYVNFRIESDRDWPAGIYRVRITLNGKEMDVVSFKVR